MIYLLILGVIIAIAYFIIIEMAKDQERKIKAYKKELLSIKISDGQFNLFVQHVYAAKIRNMPKFECKHKTHRDKRTPEECIRRQEYYYKDAVKKEALKFAKGRSLGYRNSIMDIMRHMDNIKQGVYRSFVLRVSQKDEFTSDKWKKLNGTEYRFMQFPEIPEFGNSIIYEAVLKDE